MHVLSRCIAVLAVGRRCLSVDKRRIRLEFCAIRRGMKTLQQIISAPCVDPYEPAHQLGPDYIIPTNDMYTTSASGAVRLRIADRGSSSKPAISVVTFVKSYLEKTPNKIALSVKRNNQWVNWSYAQYLSDIQLVAKAFIKLGLERFHTVGILGFNSPEWVISNFGAIFAGGISTGIYTTNSPEACWYVLENSEANIIVVENDEQLQKILKVRHRLPKLKAIVQYLGTPSSEEVLSWEDILQIGRSVPDDVLERRVKSLAINQCCTLVYTSGTTGQPKGVMVSHDNVLATVHSVPYTWPKIEGNTNGRVVSYLPLSHVAAQIGDIYVLAFTYESTLFFAQPDALKGSLIDTLKEVSPTVFWGVPRVFEKMCEKIVEAERQMGSVQRAVFNWARRCASVYTLSKLQGKPIVPFGYTIAERVIKKIHVALGLADARSIYSAGGALSEDLQLFFLSLGIALMQIYGMTESPAHTLTTEERFRIGSVGKDTCNYETILANPNSEGHGEICTKGRHVFMGYLKMEDQTLEALDKDGYVHTGDIGYFDSDNFLYTTGRIKDILITAGGENVAPDPIEFLIKEELPFVNHAVVIGDKRKFLSVLLTVKTDADVNTLEPLDSLLPQSLKWCRSIGSNARTVQEFLEDKEGVVAAATQAGIDRVNEKAISNAQKLKKWTVLPHDFSLPGGELGPTLKVKRQVVFKKYEDTIEKFYAN